MAKIKKEKKRLTLTKKALITIGVIVATPVLAILISLAIYPIRQYFEKNRYIALDSEVSKIYNNLKTVANNGDDWKYTKVCEAEYSSWMTTGKYFCHATISMEKTVTSVAEVADIQGKYYPIIDSSKSLKPETELSLTPSGFGKIFATGTAEKHYVETDQDIKCWYTNRLMQSEEVKTTLSSDSLGNDIVNNRGLLRMELDCSGKTLHYWYEPDERTKMLVE